MTQPIATPRTGFAGIAAYKPDDSDCAIDLSDNTNRWGSPPAAMRELAQWSASLARYPECYSATLRDSLADYVSVAAENIIVGAGSDNILDAAIRAFGNPGDVLSFASPSFQMVPHFARVNGLRVSNVPYESNGDVDVDALLRDDPAIVYVCSPNNPTGLPIQRATLEQIAARAKGVVIIDEAYAEFAGTSAASLVARSPRVLIVRTLSKAWGLAGLRVGYGVAHSSVIGEIEKSRGPFAVSAPSERAATSALREDRAWMRARVREAVENRERLLTSLRAREFAPLDSASNFVLLPVRDARAAASALRSRGVAVRAFERLGIPSDAFRAANGSALRVTVGPWPEMEIVIDALDSWRASCD